MRKKKPFRKPSPEILQTLANNLRAYRREQEISQEDFADVCNLHRTFVGTIERCERNVTLSTLEAFAQVMGVSVPELLTPHDHESPNDQSAENPQASQAP